MNILVVDDVAESRFLLESLLRGGGYETCSAANGAEAFERLKAGGVDLVISDILMPVMDGFQLCRKIRADKSMRHIPFIFYTATYTGPRDEDLALKTGADRFIIKPCEPDVLLEALSGVIEKADRGRMERGEGPETEKEIYKLYSERLVRKLEKKMLDLEKELARREKAEKQTRKLLMAVEQSPSMVMITDREGNIEYVNPKFEEITDYQSGELIGTNAANLGDPTEKEDADMFTVLNSGQEWRGTFHNRKKNGEFYWERASISPVSDESGSITNFVKVAEDITGQKEQERELETERARIYTILSALDTGLSLINRDKTIAWVNEKIRRMFPYRDPLGQVCHAFYEGSAEPCDPCPTMRSFNAGEKCEATRFNVREGRWYHVISQPLFDKQGKVTQVLEAVTDVTSKKKMEILLKESEARYRNIIETSPVGIAVHCDGKVVFANKAGSDLLGAGSPAELIGKPINEIIHPDNWNAARERVQRMLSGEKGLYPVEDRYVRLDGKTIEVEVRATPLPYEGRPAVQVIVQDITEKKKTERELRESRQKYKEIFDSIIDIFYRTDNEGRITIVSPSVKDIFGYTAEEIIGKKLSSFYLHAEQRNEFISVLRDQEKVKGYEAEMIKKDGSVIWVSTNAAFYRDEKGDVLGIQGISRDVTEYKIVEKERKELESRLVQAQKMEAIGTLAGGIAHDFNNILSAIMGFTQLAMEQVSGESPIYSDLQEVYRGGERARNLVSQILTFSRQKEQEIAPIQIAPVVKEALKLLRSTLPAIIDRFDLVITDMTMPGMTGDRLAQEIMKPLVRNELASAIRKIITDQDK